MGLGVGGVGLGLRMRMGLEANNLRARLEGCGEVKDARFGLLQEVQTTRQLAA
jgi:hypothetical protein